MEQKIESKDHLWKPAPIVGRELPQKEVKQTYSQQVTQMKDVMLPNFIHNQPAIPDL